MLSCWPLTQAAETISFIVIWWPDIKKTKVVIAFEQVWSGTTTSHTAKSDQFAAPIVLKRKKEDP